MYNNHMRSQKGFAHLLLVLLIVVVAIVASLVGYKVISSRPQPQPTLTVNFVDLAKVDKISKFRSCQGHIVVPQDENESRRNMKHYVVLKPEFHRGNKVNIYSPFDGVIKSIRRQPSAELEGEIWLGNRNNEWAFSVQHIVVADGAEEGQKVKAGQVIGVVANRGIDVVYGVGAKETKSIEGYSSPYSALDSVFNHASEAFLADYATRKITPTDMVYSKDYRDKNPCKLEPNGPSQGQLNDHDHPEDWVSIN